MGKLNLLKTAADFGRFRNSRSYQNPTLKIRIVSSVSQNIPRFGFIVPKKVLPKVTDRNVVKRRLKFIWNKHQSHIKPVDVLFFPQKLILKKKFIDLDSETTQLLKRAGVWKQ